MVVIFTVAPLVNETAEPDATTELIISPTLPADASLLVVVPIIPDVVLKVMLPNVTPLEVAML